MAYCATARRQARRRNKAIAPYRPCAAKQDDTPCPTDLRMGGFGVPPSGGLSSLKEGPPKGGTPNRNHPIRWSTNESLPRRKFTISTATIPKGMRTNPANAQMRMLAIKGERQSRAHQIITTAAAKRMHAKPY